MNQKERTTELRNALQRNACNADILTILKKGSVNLGIVATPEGETLFHWACKTGCSEIVQELLANHSQDINVVDALGRHGLHLAAQNAHLAVCKLLLDKYSVNPNVTDSEDWTPLHYASFEDSGGHKEMFDLLINHGINITAATTHGKWAIDFYIDSGRADVLINNFSNHLLVLIEVLVAMNKRSNLKSSKEISMFPNYVVTIKKEPVTDGKFKKEFNYQPFWRTIFQKDDVGSAEKMYNSPKSFESINSAAIFEDTINFSNDQFSDMFNDCYENTSGLYGYIKNTYGGEIKSNNFYLILSKMSGLTNLKDTFLEESYRLFQSPDTTAPFLAFLCGRLKLTEYLLRIRPLDTLPLGLVIILLSRRLADQSDLDDQLVRTLNSFSDTLEGIIGDEMSRVFLVDNSVNKRITVAFLDTRLASYNNCTMIDLANKARCANFLSLPCCQLALERRWRYGLANQPKAWRWFLKLLPIFFFLRNLTLRKGEESVVFLKVIQAPCTKHIYHSIVHVVFLLILAYVILYDFHFKISIAEGLFIAFLFGCIVEEIRELLYTSLRHYLYDLWNWIDMLAIISSLVAVIIRLTYLNEYHRVKDGYSEAFHGGMFAARVIFTMSLLLFSVRTLPIVSVYYILGSKLKMLAGMLKKDLLPMVAVFAIFIVAFGVLFQGVLFPNGFSNEGPRQYWTTTLGHVFRRSFYGMLVPNYIIEETTCGSGSPCANPWGQFLVLYIFNVIYALIANVLLVNLLIALFSNTIDHINQRSIALWHADRYNMINEYRRRSIFPIPFNIITNIIEIIPNIIRKVKSHKKARRSQEHLDGKHSVEFLVTQAFSRLKRTGDKLSPVGYGSELRKSTETRLILKFEDLDEELLNIMKTIENLKSAMARKEANKAK